MSVTASAFKANSQALSGTFSFDTTQPGNNGVYTFTGSAKTHTLSWNGGLFAGGGNAYTITITTTRFTVICRMSTGQTCTLSFPGMPPNLLLPANMSAFDVNNGVLTVA